MPKSCSLCLVRFVWHLRAKAFLRWARSISSDVRSSNFLGSRRLSHQNGINAAIAVWTWHSVNSEFFPPEFMARPRQE